MCDESSVKQLESLTYVHNHRPNCPKPHEVRLVGKDMGTLDHIRDGSTKDIVGWGMSFEEAAREALVKLDKDQTDDG